MKPIIDLIKENKYSLWALELWGFGLILILLFPSETQTTGEVIATSVLSILFIFVFPAMVIRGAYITKEFLRKIEKQQKGLQ